MNTHINPFGDVTNTTNATNINNNNIQKMMKSPRSLPIPKEVNKFVIKNYGAIYYNSSDSQQKAVILKQIEDRLKTAGYQISGSEIERRLKNMKSHYRRKKNDLEMGLTTSVEWEYFDMLELIFKDADEKASVVKEEGKASMVVITPKKREAKEGEMKPQDL